MKMSMRRGWKKTPPENKEPDEKINHLLIRLKELEAALDELGQENLTRMAVINNLISRRAVRDIFVFMSGLIIGFCIGIIL